LFAATGEEWLSLLGKYFTPIRIECDGEHPTVQPLEILPPTIPETKNSSTKEEMFLLQSYEWQMPSSIFFQGGLS